MFTRDQFRLANGYPNGFWGWGVEDHDLLNRLECVGLRLDRRHWHGKLDCGVSNLTVRAQHPDPDEESILGSNPRDQSLQPGGWGLMFSAQVGSIERRNGDWLARKQSG